MHIIFACGHEEGWQRRELPLTVVRNMAYHEDRNVRMAAYEAELKAYEKIDEAVASSLNGIKGEFLTISKKRGYKDPLEATLETAKMDRRFLILSWMS